MYVNEESCESPAYAGTLRRGKVNGFDRLTVNSECHE
jgi:hypothetical protein